MKQLGSSYLVLITLSLTISMRHMTKFEEYEFIADDGRTIIHTIAKFTCQILTNEGKFSKYVDKELKGTRSRGINVSV